MIARQPKQSNGEVMSVQDNDDFDDFEEDDEDDECLIECPYCTDGWCRTEGGICVECPECGGTGWY